MNWNKSIRQLHRWLSIIFMIAVIVTTIVLQTDNPPAWVNYISLPPLFLLMATGVYMQVVHFKRTPPT